MTIHNSILLLISIVGGIYDWKSRKIPNWLTFGTFILGLLFNVLRFNISDILNCLLGFVVGVLILFIPYIKGGIGAGDVKLLGAIGALAGYKNVILIFMYSGISGLLLGLIWLFLTPGHFKFLITTGQILPTVDKKQKVPYGIAILAGTILYIIFGSASFFNFPLPQWQ